MKGFHFSLLEFKIRYLESGEVPEKKSSALRGGLGQTLSKMFCVLPEHFADDKTTCRDCICQSRCIVQNVMYAKYKIKPDFVTDVESEGFTLNCYDRRTYVEEGDYTYFTIIFYGDTVSLFTPVLEALHNFGLIGLGKENVSFAVESVSNRKHEKIMSEGQIDNSNILVEDINQYIRERREELNMQEDFKIIFKSPCYIKFQGKVIYNFEPEAIIRAAARRIYMFQLFEGIESEELREFEIPNMISERSRNVTVKRYSNVQAQSMNLKGIVGFMELSNVTEEVLDILLAGEITKIGKNTRFGFG
nr:CRISPR system precrRNA processing endoribonuclease RAMP protein Cas6 [Lachnospiraceae bacterium]